MPAYTCIWEFVVKPEHEARFIEHYGPEGSWARLFRQAPGFVGTLLLRDQAAPLRFVTIDRWQNARAFETFRERYAQQYELIDSQCRELTVSERPIGAFDG